MNSSDTMHLETRVPLKEMMSSNPTTLDYNATVAEAARAMCRDDVGSCIILENGLPIGIATEQDINCKVVALDRRPSEVQVSEIMSTPLITIGADRSVSEAAQMMVRHKVRRLPVVDENYRVIGIVTVRDILSVANEINEIMTDLILINRVDGYEGGVCERCGIMASDLVRSDGQLLCSHCRVEENL
ncbi:MAG TPA: CBS domain-containing protein [Methanoregulaceae archaeon]|nr:CBS domain-containing protein [Methanoregulaceae archaeon]